jgi:hypothetical protein
MTSSTGGPFSNAQWPGGQATLCSTPSCCVTVNRPSGDIVLVGTLGSQWTLFGFSGYVGCSFVGACNAHGGTCTSCTGVDAPSSCRRPAFRTARTSGRRARPA